VVTISGCKHYGIYLYFYTRNVVLRFIFCITRNTLPCYWQTQPRVMLGKKDIINNSASKRHHLTKAVVPRQVWGKILASYSSYTPRGHIHLHSYIRVSHLRRGTDYTCIHYYHPIAFLSGCISITISIHGPSPDKETHTHSYIVEP